MSDTFNIVIQFSKLLFIVLFIAHWGACFWYFLGISEYNEKGNSWISQANLINNSVYDQYISSIYYYITTMTTVGYGDITPITSNEKIYAMFSMIMACGVFAYVVGSIGTVLSSRYDEEMIFKQKIMYVDQYLKNKHLSNTVRTKVRRYLEHVLENKREQKIDESEILSLLNKNLKEEVIMHLNGLLLKNGTFATINRFDEFCLLLTNVMREETLNPGDIIFQKGDHSLRLYFINNGIVTIFDQETKIIFKELNNKTNCNSFGEIGFFAGLKRCASAESLTFANLTYILVDLFKEIAYKFKSMHQSKFKEFEDELSILRKEIRQKIYLKLKTKCYLCEASTHIAPDCSKLKNFNEFFKFNFKDRRHKTEAEIKRIYDFVASNSGSTNINKAISDHSKPSFSKNTDELFFSFADIYEDEEENAQSNSDNDIRKLSLLKADSSSSSNSKSNSSSRSSKKSKKEFIENPQESFESNSDRSKSSNVFDLKNNINSVTDIEASNHLRRNESIQINEDSDNTDTNNQMLTLDDNKTKFGKLLQISDSRKTKE
jgi:CRP-like cAMP-binding protein